MKCTIAIHKRTRPNKRPISDLQGLISSLPELVLGWGELNLGLRGFILGLGGLITGFRGQTHTHTYTVIRAGGLTRDNLPAHD